MKMFVWKRVKQVSDNYHAEGGLMVVAKDEKAARAAANNTSEVTLESEEKPDLVYAVSGPEIVVTFPDAGCC